MAAGGPHEPAWPEARVAWYGVGVLLVAYTFSFIDRTIIALLVEPIKRDLALSDTQFSLLHGLAFAIFYTTLGIPIGRLADRHSRRRIIAIGIFVWSMMTAACGLARNFWQLFIARVGVGVGEAALSPAAYSMIADSFPPRQLGRALGVYSVGVYLGAGLAFIIGGAVIQAVSSAPAVTLPVLGEVRAWQLTFFWVGLPGVLVAAWMYTVREPVRRNVLAGTQPTVAEVLRFTSAGWRAYASHFVGFALLALVFNAVIGWAPAFLMRSYGMSQSGAGYSLGLLILCFGSTGIVAGGWYADRLAARGRSDGAMRTGILSALGLAPFAALAPLMPGPGGALAMFAPLMFFSSFGFGAAAAALQLITPNEMRAQVSAVYLFLINLVGIGLGPVLTALVTDYVFADEAAVRYSIALVAGLAAPLAALVLWAGLAPFRARYALQQAA